MKRLAIVLLLGGCAGLGGAPSNSDKIMFDRGAFALGYADMTAPARIKCEKNPTTAACVKFTTLDDQMRSAITAPPPVATPQTDPFTQLLPVIMKLAPLLAL
jgi:hypothetical protein